MLKAALLKIVRALCPSAQPPPLNPAPPPQVSTNLTAGSSLSGSLLAGFALGCEGSTAVFVLTCGWSTGTAFNPVASLALNLQPSQPGTEWQVRRI